MAKRSRRLAGNQRVAGSIPGGDIYFHLDFFSFFPTLQAGGALVHVNEIKHDHTPVETPDTINHKGLVYL